MRLIGNVLWFVLAGLWLAIAYLAAALVMFILIITIPFGLGNFKLIPISLWALRPRDRADRGGRRDRRQPGRRALEAIAGRTRRSRAPAASDSLGY